MSRGPFAAHRNQAICNQDSALSWGVYGQRFDAMGDAAGSEFAINATLLDDQRNPAVSMNPSGEFVVAWEGHGLLGALFPGIYVRRYNSSGVAQGSEIGVEGSLILSVNRAAVAMAPDGSFVVAWEDSSLSGRGISARMYDSSGSPLGSAFTVNQTTTGTQELAAAAADSSGEFFVGWSGQGSGDSSGVFIRRVTAACAPISGAFSRGRPRFGVPYRPCLLPRPRSRDRRLRS